MKEKDGLEIYEIRRVNGKEKKDGQVSRLQKKV